MGQWRQFGVACYWTGSGKHLCCDLPDILPAYLTTKVVAGAQQACVPNQVAMGRYRRLRFPKATVHAGPWNLRYCAAADIAPYVGPANFNPAITSPGF